MSVVAKVTVENPSADELSGYAVRVDITDPTFFDYVTNPDYLTVVDESMSNKLPFYVYKMDTVSKVLTMWVRIPYIPANGSVVFYVLYDLSIKAPESNPYNTFDFYDGFEVWEGWSQHGNGVVEQSSEIVYKGNYSLKKTGYSDPNGGVKHLGFTLDYPFELHAMVNRYDFAGGAADRFGVVDDNGNGYGFVLGHDPTNNRWDILIDKREDYSGYTDSGEFHSGVLRGVWYEARFRWNNGAMEAIVDVNGQKYTHTRNDTAYKSFTQVYVFGGYDYFMDELWIRKYHDPEPIVTVEVGKEISLYAKDVFGNEVPVGYVKVPPGGYGFVEFPFKILTVVPVTAEVYAPSYAPVTIKLDPSEQTVTAILKPVMYDLTNLIRKILSNKMVLKDGYLTIYDDDGVTPILTFRLLDAEGRPTDYDVYQRIPE